jgi:hypothetical protein
MIGSRTGSSMLASAAALASSASWSLARMSASVSQKVMAAALPAERSSSTTTPAYPGNCSSWGRKPSSNPRTV